MSKTLKGGKMLFQKRSIMFCISLLFVLCLFSVQQDAFAMFTSLEVNPVIETRWLEDNLYKTNVRVIYVDNWPTTKSEYESGHIPGSVFMGIGGMMGAIGNGSAPPDKAKFESVMGNLGVKKTDHVVVYSKDGNNPFTLSAAWLMEYFGHRKVSFLNGGLSKWKMEKRDVKTSAPAPSPTKYTAGSPNNDIYIDAENVLKNLNNSNVAIVDARGTDEYTGENNEEKNKRVGHIPGAQDLGFYETNFNKDGTLKSAEELKAAYESKGVTRDKEVISYCQAGIKAGNDYFVLKHVLGYSNVKVYIGSWGEWSNRLDPEKHPIEK
jgi:thiosulfate/3-mercaptopyruvate sulfurtransferase